MDSPRIESRDRLQAARRFFNMAVLGGVIAFLGPCAGNVVQFDVGTDQAFSFLRVFEAAPNVLGAAGLILAILGTFKISRMLRDSGTFWLVGSTVVGAFALIATGVAMVLVLGGRVGERPWFLAQTLAGLGGYAWLWMLSEGMRRSVRAADLSVPARYWQWTGRLAMASLASAVLFPIFAWLFSFVAGVPVLILFGFLLGLIPVGALICFFMSASETHKTLRTLQRSHAMRAGA